jgi:hypothetical protein
MMRKGRLVKHTENYRYWGFSFEYGSYTSGSLKMCRIRSLSFEDGEWVSQ